MIVPSLGIFWTSEIIEMSHMFQNTDLVMIAQQWYIKYHLKWIHNRKFPTNIFAVENMMCFQSFNFDVVQLPGPTLPPSYTLGSSVE